MGAACALNQLGKETTATRDLHDLETLFIAISMESYANCIIKFNETSEFHFMSKAFIWMTPPRRVIFKQAHTAR